MRRSLLTYDLSCWAWLTLAAFMCISLLSKQASADEPLGAYVGGAIGQAHVSASVITPESAYVNFNRGLFRGVFDENHLAYKLMVGIRPISLVGAELSYIDLGSPSGEVFGYPASASMRGPAAFGMLYLPVPIVDIYAKAGIARLHTVLSGLYPNGDNYCAPSLPCGTAPFGSDRTATTFAVGTGAQYRFGSWAVRTEYERFDADAEHPSLLSLGLTWTL